MISKEEKIKWLINTKTIQDFENHGVKTWVRFNDEAYEKWLRNDDEYLQSQYSARVQQINAPVNFPLKEVETR